MGPTSQDTNTSRLVTQACRSGRSLPSGGVLGQAGEAGSSKHPHPRPQKGALIFTPVYWRGDCSSRQWFLESGGPQCSRGLQGPEPSLRPPCALPPPPVNGTFFISFLCSLSGLFKNNVCTPCSLTKEARGQPLCAILRESPAQRRPDALAGRAWLPIYDVPGHD